MSSRTPMSCKLCPYSVALDACVHLGRMPLSPAYDHSGALTPHSPSSTPRVAGPGRRACSSILMPSSILAQSVCPRGKHLSSDSGPVAISMGRGARRGPRRPGCSPARPPARSPPPRSRGGAAPAGLELRQGPPATPGERGAPMRWPRAPASCGRAGALQFAPRSPGHSQPRAPASLSPACQPRSRAAAAAADGAAGRRRRRQRRRRRRREGEGAGVQGRPRGLGGRGRRSGVPGGAQRAAGLQARSPHYSSAMVRPRSRWV